MARRIINNGEKPKMVKTTIHPSLYSALENFRTDYMRINGKYINNSIAHQFLARKLVRVKPPKLKRKRYR